MTPAEHAAAILANPAASDQVLAEHADALADAADHTDEAIRSAGISALFAGLVEPLNDGFSPRGRALYARVFPRIVWRVASHDARLSARLAELGIVDEAALRARYAAARVSTAPLPAAPRRIAILSRVTIGADILLTSVVVQRLHQRWPQAELLLLGDGKLCGLLGGLPHLRVRSVAYTRRGRLGERLASWLTLTDALREEAVDLVVAPDSRLDQLGVLPVTRDPAAYLLWENTLPEGHPQSLAERLDDWLVARLGTVWGRRALPRVAFDPRTQSAAQRLRSALGAKPWCAVKLDHGGNTSKALPRAAELAVLRRLRELGWSIILDRGFGRDELTNSDTLLADLGWSAHDIDDSGSGLGSDAAAVVPDSLADATLVRFHGSIAGWAAMVAACRLAFSYDSVGHHLAAALGVPVVVAFTGHTHADFPIAWQPRGPAAIQLVVLTLAEREQPAHWQAVVNALPPP